MSGRCFLDTNIFVYSMDGSDPAKAAVARELIRTHLSRRTGVISFQVVQEFFNVASKRFQSPLSGDDETAYLFTVLAPLLAVHSSTGLYSAGLRLSRRYRISWFDSLIVAAAIEARCAVLYSEDLQNGAVFEGVRVENPFQAGPVTRGR